MKSPVSDLVEHLTRFGRALRDEGLLVGSGQILDFCRAATALEPGNLYWAGRTTLTARREDIPVYDAVFWAFFADEESGLTSAPLSEPHPIVKTARVGGVGDRTDEEAEREITLASPIELLRPKSFANCTEEELRELFAASERLVVPTRRSRRYGAAQAGVPDFRRTLRASFRTAGEPLNRAWRARRDCPRRVVLLLDVSGSMAAYSRSPLLFAHAGVRAHRRWEAFCFATRLTRFTRALAQGIPDEALTRAAGEVLDWNGGTRIGKSLKRFLNEREHGSLARGATVIICSDGLEVDDPEILRQQMARLSRLAHRVVWLNPHKQGPTYEPLARGMRAALPYIDVFASGHNLASLEQLTEVLSRPGTRRGRAVLRCPPRPAERS
jgi:uncharacterized protein with von Willebrand factor type A (vWA) domain